MATSNADFYRAQFANMNNEDRQRKNALQDDFTKSQYDNLNASLANIQNNPSLSPEDKANQINTIRQQQLKIMTPGMAKGHLAKMMAQFGITDTSGPQSVPAEQPLTLSAQPAPQQQQVPFTPEEIAQGGGAVGAPSPDAMKVQPEAMSGVESLAPAPVSLPGKQAQRIAQTPTPVNAALAGTAPQNPYAVERQQLINAGFSPEVADKALQIKLGIQPKAVQLRPYKQSDYGQFLGSYADSIGKDITELTPEDHEAARQKWSTASRHVLPTKVGSLEDFVLRLAHDANVDPKDLSPQTILEARKAYQSAGQVERTSTGHYMYTDTATGNVVDVPIVRKSIPTPAPMPQIPNRQNPTVAPAQPIAPPVAPTPVAAKHQAGAIAGATPQQQPPVVPGRGAGRVIGHKASIYDQAALKGGTKALDTVRPMVNIDQTMSQYIKSGQYTPRQDLALIVSAVRAMNPGTVRLPQAELVLELKAGSWGDRMQRSWEMASAGTLPTAQRQDLYRIVHHETAVSAANAARELQSAGGQVPPILQPYTAEGNPDEQVKFTVDGQHVVMGTRQQMEQIEAAGHKVLREQ
jgi:hypothetical protein